MMDGGLAGFQNSSGVGVGGGGAGGGCGGVQPHWKVWDGTLSFMKWTLMPPEIAILRENKVELMEMLRVIVVG